jgi:hypothetical protein
MLNMQHAFEMLLKAVLVDKNVRVFDKRSGRSIGCRPLSSRSLNALTARRIEASALSVSSKGIRSHLQSRYSSTRAGSSPASTAATACDLGDLDAAPRRPDQPPPPLAELIAKVLSTREMQVGLIKLSDLILIPLEVVVGVIVVAFVGGILLAVLLAVPRFIWSVVTGADLDEGAWLGLWILVAAVVLALIHFGVIELA